MSTLTIRKKSLKTWLHTDSILGNFIISKFYFNADNTSFQIVEQGQSKRVIYNINDITLYNEVDGGGAETFSTITQLSLRLEELNYTAFQIDGQITSIANLIESGTNVTIVGDGTLASPYIISSTGGGGGGSQTLAQTLVLGNATDGEDILLSDGDAVLIDNGSKLKKGTTNAGNGGNNGVALKCSLDYELKWEAGRLYIMEQDGFTIREVSHNFTVVPAITDDTTKGFVVGSRWLLDDGTLYTCSDATAGAAVWDVTVIGTPTLDEVLTEGNTTDLTAIFESEFGRVTVSPDGHVEVRALGTGFDEKTTYNDGFFTKEIDGNQTQVQFTPPTGSGIINIPDVVNSTETLALLSDIPTNTSDLINDGDDGNPFISLLDLPSNIIFYPTNVASDIGGYVKIVTSITDPSYNTTAVDISTGAITTTNQLISSLATSPNIIVGNPGVFNITTIGNIRRISGSGTASFYFQVYKRTSAGVETLVATSANTIPVLDSGTYVEFSATAIWDDGIFLDTDRVVMKYYANRIAGGSNPTYQFQFGGVTPVRTLVPIPLSVVPILTIDAVPTDGSTNAVSSNGVFDALALKQKQILIAKQTTNSTSLTGTTAEGILESILIPANTFAVGDIMKVLNAMNKIGTAGNSQLRTRINTVNSLVGSVVISTGSINASNVLSGANPERHFNIRSGNLIEGFPFTVASVYENGGATNNQRTSTTFDPTQDAYILLTAQLGSGSDSVVNAQYLIEKY
jgi:hypothetical protein